MKMKGYLNDQASMKNSVCFANIFQLRNPESLKHGK